MSLLSLRRYHPDIRAIGLLHLLFIHCGLVFAQPIDAFRGVEHIVLIHGHGALAMPHYLLVELGLSLAQPLPGMAAPASPVAYLVLIKYGSHGPYQPVAFIHNADLPLLIVCFWHIVSIGLIVDVAATPDVLAGSDATPQALLVVGR